MLALHWFYIVVHSVFCVLYCCVFVFEQVKAIEREKQEEERSQGQNEENRHATRHQVP